MVRQLTAKRLPLANRFDDFGGMGYAGLIEWSKNGLPRKIVYLDDAMLKGKKYKIFGNLNTRNILPILLKRIPIY